MTLPCFRCLTPDDLLASGISYLPYGGINGLTYGNGLSLSHGYDNQYRISSIIVGSIMSRTYGYDPNGNIASIIDAIEPSGNEVFEDAGIYTYQQTTNKLTQVQGELNIIYGYDANGNITSANNRTFTYDLSNRLIRVENNGTTVGEYVYNANNQRIKKIVQGATRIFHYDLAGRLIAETNDAGQNLAEYVYLGDQVLCKISGELAYYYHNDHLGTPQILTNDSGIVSWKAVYTPFGDAEIQVETVENPFRFPGQYYDQETGLHYNWNRYYDPKTGRYLTPDPVGLEGGINLFVYVENNPVIFVDPAGTIVIAPVIAACVANPVCRGAVACVGAAVGTGILETISALVNRSFNWCNIGCSVLCNCLGAGLGAAIPQEVFWQVFGGAAGLAAAGPACNGLCQSTFKCEPCKK